MTGPWKGASGEQVTKLSGIDELERQVRMNWAPSVCDRNMLLLRKRAEKSVKRNMEEEVHSI